MHMVAFVVVPKDTTIENSTERVENLMAPYCEYDSDLGFWDWWQIGGRWTGLYAEYDPKTDPRNIDENGKVNWPTQWVNFEGDIVPVEVLLNNPTLPKPYSIVTPTGDFHKFVWNGDDFVSTENWDELIFEILEPYRNEKFVIVDYHS